MHNFNKHHFSHLFNTCGNKTKMKIVVFDSLLYDGRNALSLHTDFQNF